MISKNIAYAVENIRAEMSGERNEMSIYGLQRENCCICRLGKHTFLMLYCIVYGTKLKTDGIFSTEKKQDW